MYPENRNPLAEMKACTNKKPYENVKNARKAIKVYKNNFKRDMYWYKCKYCKAYHLTKSKRGNE